MAGPLGQALLSGMLDRGWLVRAGETRALRLTTDGQAGLAVELGVVLP